jgi:hypothetical protein
VYQVIKIYKVKNNKKKLLKKKKENKKNKTKKKTRALKFKSEHDDSGKLQFAGNKHS